MDDERTSKDIQRSAQYADPEVIGAQGSVPPMTTAPEVVMAEMEAAPADAEAEVKVETHPGAAATAPATIDIQQRIAPGVVEAVKSTAPAAPGITPKEVPSSHLAYRRGGRTRRKNRLRKSAHQSVSTKHINTNNV